MFPPTELSDQWPQFYGRHGGSFYIIFQDKQRNRMLDIHCLDNTYLSRKTKSNDITEVLKRLGDVHKKMAKVEGELHALRKEYAILKDQL